MERLYLHLDTSMWGKLYIHLVKKFHIFNGKNLHIMTAKKKQNKQMLSAAIKSLHPGTCLPFPQTTYMYEILEKSRNTL